MSKFTFSLSSVTAIISAGLALAADVKPLFDLAGQAMDALEQTTIAGPDKKTAVLNIVSLAAADAGKDFSLIAADIAAFIDGAKGLYNAMATAAADLKAALAAKAAPVAQPLPQNQTGE